MILPETVRFYNDIRKGSPSKSNQYGVGANLYPIFPQLEQVVYSLVKSLFETQAIMQYTRSGGNELDRETIAKLVNLYLDTNHFTASDVLVTNGSSEGIDIIFHYLSSMRIDPVLPLPSYFAYDVCAKINKIAVNGYYNLRGDLWVKDKRNKKLCFLINNPDAISGKFHPSSYFEALVSDVSNLNLIVYDSPYQIMDFHDTDKTIHFLKEIKNKHLLDQVVFLFTISKDLSLAGIRSGLLVSKNQDLLRHAESLIFSRYYCVSSFCTIIMIVYLFIAIQCNTHYAHRSAVFQKSLSILEQSRFDFSTLTSDLVREIILWKDDMNKHLSNNFDFLARNYPEIFDLDNSFSPDAGFSGFMRLPWKNPGIVDVIDICRKLSTQYMIKINPTYMFGGTNKAWKLLYPSELHIRTNASTDLETLIAQTDLLREAFEHIIGNNRRWVSW